MSRTNDGKLTILVVEDIEETRDGIEKLLSATGYHLEAFRDERGAVEHARRKDPDLILVSRAGHRARSSSTRDAFANARGLARTCRSWSLASERWAKVRSENRNSFLPEQAVELVFDHPVALADGRLQLLPVEYFDVTTNVADRAHVLQPTSGHGHAFAPDAEHVGD